MDQQHKRILTGRVSKAQKQKLIDLMQHNRAIACGQFSGPNSNKKMHEFWHSASIELNACSGANKNKEQWKKCWADWKSSVKKQYCAFKRFQNQTGNRPSDEGPKPVEGLDADVMTFFPADAVDGDTTTREGCALGVKEKPVTHEELEEDIDLLLENDENVAVTPRAIAKPNEGTPKAPNVSFYCALQQVETKMDAQEQRMLSALGTLNTSVQNIEKMLNEHLKSKHNA